MFLRKVKVVTVDRFGNAPDGLRHGLRHGDIVKDDIGRYQVIDRKLKQMYEGVTFNEETGYYRIFIGMELI